MDSPTGSRFAFLETLPPPMIRVEKPQRMTSCATIAEESRGGEHLEALVTSREVAPTSVIPVKKQAFQSSLDTIWEERMHYMAEYVAAEAADVIMRPVMRFNYFDKYSLTPSWGVAKF